MSGAMTEMTPAEKLALCYERARKIVALYRAQAPVGCDPRMTWVAVGVGVVALAGTAYTASEQKKAAKAQAGNQRDPQSEISGMLGIAPDLMKEQYVWDRLMGESQLDFSEKFAGQAMALYPKMAEAERTATTMQRGQDAKDLKKFGGKLMEGLRSANPGFGTSLDALNSRVASAGARTPLMGSLNEEAMGMGPSAIRSELERQALSDLALGGRLSPEEERMAQQTARAGWADRGLLMSDPALIEEVMNREGLSRQRLAERRGFAGNAMQAGLSEDMANRSFRTNVEGLNYQELLGERSFLGQAAQVNQAALNPVLAFMGRTGVSPGIGAGMLGAAPGITGASTGLLSSLLGYGQDSANTNFNAFQAQQIARANNAAALSGSVIGAAGDVGSAYMQSQSGKGGGQTDI